MRDLGMWFVACFAIFGVAVLIAAFEAVLLPVVVIALVFAGGAWMARQRGR